MDEKLVQAFEEIDGLECEVDRTRVEFEYAEKNLSQSREKHHELFAQHAKTHIHKVAKGVCPVCGGVSTRVAVPEHTHWPFYYQIKLHDMYLCAQGHTFHCHDGYASTLNDPKTCILCALDYPDIESWLLCT